MKTRNRFIISLLFFSFTFFFHAQQTIKGKILNKDDGHPIPGVKIKIDKTYLGTFSDEKGFFQFSNLKKGNYSLVFSLLGYETQIESVTIQSQDIELDVSLQISTLMIEEVVVAAVKAGDKSPTTFTNIGKEQLQNSNFGQDIPYLLESSPSTVVTSDAGGGVGYTSISIRGVDPTRTNVTINGIPLNDPESHSVYWVNMPDFVSTTDNIQIQRGVGTSSNGAAAFGASINLKTDKIIKSAYAEIDNSVGSFQTMRNTFKVGTGLLNEKFSFDARLSNIQSNGFIDRAKSDLKSYYLAGAYVGKKSLLRATVFSGKEVTYQAWYGVHESRIKGDLAEMNNYADRNGLTDEERENLINSGRTHNYYQYDNEVDNYQQSHYQLHYTYNHSPKLNVNLAGHYTYGRGYFEQFRRNDKLSNYGLEPVEIGGELITRSDIIRRRWLDNHFYGGVFSVNYTNLNGFNLTFGGAVNAYDGDHFGEIIWAKFASNSNIRDRYYDNNSLKIDANTYLKATYQYKKFNFYGDLQVRNIDYTFLGLDEVNGQLEELTQNVKYTFFNPKGGLSYDFNEKNSLYASLSVANREPIRKDFRESTPSNRPLPETLNNIEAGYKLKNKKMFFNANYYLMSYKNQLVLTGKINDVGDYTRFNVEKSYRSGIEIEGGLYLLKNLTLTGNLTLSKNKIVAFTEFIDEYNENWDYVGQKEIQHSNTDLALSPNIIASLSLNYEPIKNLNINVLSKYVGKQFLDNTSNIDRMLNEYYITNISINYSLKTKLIKEINFGILVNNVFNYLYENNGYTWGYIADGTRISENFYFPQAGINCLGRVSINF
jgi:iron complex outermembrane recepter protein